MQLALDYIVFLGLSDDETVEPDAAIAQLESVACLLRTSLDESEIGEFLDFTMGVAERERTVEGMTPRVEFIRSIGDALGLA